MSGFELMRRVARRRRQAFFRWLDVRSEKAWSIFIGWDRKWTEVKS